MYFGKHVFKNQKKGSCQNKNPFLHVGLCLITYLTGSTITHCQSSLILLLVPMPLVMHVRGVFFFFLEVWSSDDRDHIRRA